MEEESPEPSTSLALPVDSPILLQPTFTTPSYEAPDQGLPRALPLARRPGEPHELPAVDRLTEVKEPPEEEEGPMPDLDYSGTECASDMEEEMLADLDSASEPDLASDSSESDSDEESSPLPPPKMRKKTLPPKGDPGLLSEPAKDDLARAHFVRFASSPQPEPPSCPVHPSARQVITELEALATLQAMKQHTLRTFQTWRRRKHKLRKEQQAWTKMMDPSVRQVAGHVQLLLMGEMLTSISHKDKHFTKEFHKGFQPRGIIPSANIYGGEPPLKPKVYDTKPFRATREPTKECPAEWVPPLTGKESNLVHQSACDEADLKLLEGPFRRQDLPWPHFYPALRFIVHQSGLHGTDEWRAVDSLSDNGCNTGVFHMEKMNLTTLDEVVAFHQLLQAAFPPSDWGMFHMWKVDLWKAFKQCPTLPEFHPWAVFATKVPEDDPKRGLKKGEVVYWYPRALPFGAAASPYHFSRLAFALVQIAREIFLVPMQNYLDDFWGMGPAVLAWHHYRTFCEILNLLGFRRKTAKEHPPDRVTPLLGVLVAFSMSSIRISIQPERQTRLMEDIKAILLAGELCVGLASKLTGRLSFAGSTMVGRLGRAYLYILYRFVAEGGARQRHSTRRLSQQIRHALNWWVVALANAPQREFSLLPLRQGWELWTDAALVPHGLGAVLAPSHHPKSAVAIGEFPGTTLQAWLPSVEDTDRVIYQLELLAVLWAIIHFGDHLDGGSMRLWIDNEAARFGLINGYSSNPWAARIISEIWIQLARRAIHFFIERVESARNISDGPSRDYWALIEALSIPRQRALPALKKVCSILEENTALLFGAARPPV